MQQYYNAPYTVNIGDDTFHYAKTCDLNNNFSLDAPSYIILE